MSYILIRADPPHHPVYTRDAKDRFVPLIFDDQYAAAQSITFFLPGGREQRDPNYTVVRAEGEGLRRYIEWANLSRDEVKAWLRRKNGAVARVRRTDSDLTD